MAILLLNVAPGASCDRADTARDRVWGWTVVGAAVLLLALVAMTASKVVSGMMGMYRLDSPITFAALALAGVYAVAAVLLQFTSRRS